MSQPRSTPRATPRMGALAVLTAAALLAAACGHRPPTAEALGLPRPAGAAASAPAQCVPEGQSCAAAAARCCPGLDCMGLGKPICLLAP